MRATLASNRKPASTASLLPADESEQHDSRAAGESRHRDTVPLTTETPLPLQRCRPCCEPLLSCSDVTPGPVSSIDDMLSAPSFPPLLFLPPWPLVLLAALVLGGLSLACTAFRAPLAAAVGTTEAALVKQLLEFASIPLTSLLVTYLHIWLALYLTFYPAAYVGCLQLPGTNLGLGWQGIVPFKRVKFARKATQLMSTKLVTVAEMLARLEPHRMAAAMGEAYLDGLADQALAAAAAAGAPRLWEWQPEWARRALGTRVRRAARLVLSGALSDLRAAAELEGAKLFSLDRLVQGVLEPNPRLTSRMFIQCGWQELAFIRNTGAVMGAGFGLLQMVLWAFYRQPWTLPAFGALVGALTNYLAMLAIFRPHRPVPLFPPRLRRALSMCIPRRWCRRCACCRDSPPTPGSEWAVEVPREVPREVLTRRPPSRTPSCTLQGLFIKHQAKVARIYASIVASSIVTPRAVLAELTQGAAGARLTEIARRRTLEAAEPAALLASDDAGTDAGAGRAGGGTGGAGGMGGAGGDGGAGGEAMAGLIGAAARHAVDVHKAREAACAVVCGAVAEAVQRTEAYVAEALRLEETLRERIAALPPADFEDILHSVFKEDEWKLFALGGAMGLAIGLVQAYALTR